MRDGWAKAPPQRLMWSVGRSERTGPPRRARVVGEVQKRRRQKRGTSGPTLIESQTPTSAPVAGPPNPRANQLVEAGLWLRLSGDLVRAKRLFSRALRIAPHPPHTYR